MIDAGNRLRLFAPSETIEAGAWRLQLRGDEVADIEYGGYPVLRGIRLVVRDHDWRTLTPDVESITRSDEAGTTTLRLTIGFAGFNARYRADLMLRLCGGELSLSFDGVAPGSFSSNRIGLVVLHRPDDAGRALTVTSPERTSTRLAFPVEISPHQPFRDVAAMCWERDGTNFRLQFSGDTFETEDQRNWTDASFKTYSTPLSRPFPVEVRAGDRIRQSIRLTAEPAAQGPERRQPEPRQPDTGPAVLTVHHETVGTVPALGTSASRSPATLAPVPGLASLLVELSGDDRAAAAEEIRQAHRQAAELGVPLDVRISVRRPESLAGFLDLLPLDQVSRLGAFSSESHATGPALWRQLQGEAQRRGFAGTLLAGARSHFTELNRTAPSLPEAQAMTYSITPQMHASEVMHIVETLPMQRQTALNALRIGSGTALHIGPITLKPRFNAVSTGGAECRQKAESMASDPLQGEDFTAAWMLGSIASLTMPGVESVSYFEASGPRGLRTDGGADTPAGSLLTRLAGLRGAGVLKAEGHTPGMIVYPVRVGSGVVLFAANLTPKPVRVAVRLEYGHAGTIDLPAWTETARPLS
ncbi:hypothetical protein QFZ79_001107 [Arthrobacter sp. V4I6]|uniref:hypothetical protein n=1 Tax=unclassified Arthrobacter TaxID=235627 RepID=UPI0027826825|nr:MULTISPECIES: hypothetical protein [unclassified Arthrobacter]MDQ0823363.1 hypothetical protein [Arthrobacter sp. V1I7]MDQ0852996.1 hypothetical protein [Arthrobacter sp. V4I6]